MFMGAGLGLLLAIITTKSLGLVDGEATGTYFSLIAIGGGLGMLLAYLYERKTRRPKTNCKPGKQTGLIKPLRRHSATEGFCAHSPRLAACFVSGRQLTAKRCMSILIKTGPIFRVGPRDLKQLPSYPYEGLAGNMLADSIVQKNQWPVRIPFYRNFDTRLFGFDRPAVFYPKPGRAGRYLDISGYHSGPGGISRGADRFWCCRFCKNDRIVGWGRHSPLQNIRPRSVITCSLGFKIRTGASNYPLKWTGLTGFQAKCSNM